MANIKSAEKQNRQATKHRERNRAAMSRLRNVIKNTRSTFETGEQDAAKEALRNVYSVIDRTAKKGILKGNTADRYKSRLAAAARRAAQAE
ncbi:MAG: 30S ribosomal protein S20 [Thermoanaerobaculia bacterium]